MHAPARPFLGFARALALLGGVGAFPACSAAHLVEDAGPSDAGTDVAVADAPADSPHPCSLCLCDWGTDAGPGSCEAIGHSECCAEVGPLPPPDLPAVAPSVLRSA